MAALALHSFHAGRGAAFGELQGQEIVRAYSSPEAEYLHLTRAAGLLDFSFRGRLCLLGQDREKFLHGQITNDVLRLAAGEGCYAAIVDAKARLQSDLFIYKLPEEVLLDFEPGLAGRITERLEKYIIAEDVQIADVSPHFGLISLQGPESGAVLRALGWFSELPEKVFSWRKQEPEGLGEIYLARNPRLGSEGFDLFIPAKAMPRAIERLDEAVRVAGGGFAGWDALEIARIEAGIPRFGADMDEASLAPEALGLNAISYGKGCYIGQEIIARIRTYGRVAKALRVLRLPEGLSQLPRRGEKLYTADGKEAGFLTSAALSPKSGGMTGLGFVRKEHNALGTALHLGSPEGGTVLVLGLPAGLDQGKT